MKEQLLSFLGGKNPEEGYNYWSLCDCAAAQFNDAIGRKYPIVEAMQDRVNRTTFDGRLEHIARETPHTFGGALERAKREFEFA